MKAPIVSGPAELDVTFGEVHTFTIVAESNDTLTYEIESNQTGVFTVTDNTTGSFQVNVTSVNVSATFIVSDTNGMITEFKPIIKMCYCANDGNCTNATDVASGTGYLKLYICSCAYGWTGKHCLEQADVCEDDPCFPGVNCTNIYSPTVEARCGDCPSGFEGDGRSCSGRDHNYCKFIDSFIAQSIYVDNLSALLVIGQCELARI